MTVWATYGPYESAAKAEEYLRMASKIVFGEHLSDHEEWIQAHARNFKEWEADGKLQHAQELLKNASQASASGKAYTAAVTTMRESLISQVREGAEWLNKDFLEDGGHRLETVTQPDGTVALKYKQIWSDEKIADQKRKAGKSIMEAVGRNLLNDKSIEERLLAFLGLVY